MATLPDRTTASSSPSSLAEQDINDINDEGKQADLPLTMLASVVLTGLPRDATAALTQAGEFEKAKVTVRFAAIGSAPILRQKVCKISSAKRFESVVHYLRKTLRVGDGEGVFCYINSSFAPAMDEVVGNLHRCFRNQTDDQLVVNYSITPAFG